MSTPILVCTDFSAHAERSFAFATRFARALGLPVRLLHVSDADLSHGTGDGQPAEHDFARLLHQRLAESAETLRASGIHVETGIRSGSASDAIVEEAGNGLRLIVMATRGHGGFMRALFGSVTAKVVQQVRVPVLAVPEDAEDMPISRVLFPVDFSELTTGVLASAFDFLRPLDAAVEFFHVHVPVEAGSGLAMVPPTSDEAIGLTPGQRLTELAAHAAAEGLTATWTLSEEGVGAERGILDRAQAARAHLIVMAGHGRTGIDRLLLGSVTDAVMRKSDRPVLILKGG